MKNYIFTESGKKRFEDALVKKLAENFRTHLSSMHLDEAEDIIDDSDLDDMQAEAEMDIREIIAEVFDGLVILDEE